jgi:hypothetical protein
VIAILVATTIASTDKNEKPPEMADDTSSGALSKCAEILPAQGEDE